MDDVQKEILMAKFIKNICTWLHWYDTKFEPENFEHAVQEIKKAYDRYQDDAYFHKSIDALALEIMKILDEKYLIFGKKKICSDLCNYFNCSDSNDNQYPDCLNQFTDACPSGDLLFRLCKSEDIEGQEDTNNKDEMIEQLKHALSESVMLQSHYASLLNMHDGGERKTFKSINEWIQRLSDLEAAKEGML